MLALGYRNANQLEEAEPYFEHWCSLRSGDAEPFKERIEYWMKRKWLPQALADGRRVLELEPQNDALRAQVAHWALITAHHAEAERECRRCLEKQPDNPELLFLLANSVHRQGRGAEAEPILDQLVQEYPRFSGALVLRGILYVETEQPEKAIPLLRQSLTLEENPQQSAARYYLSQALARTGQEQEAKRVLAEMQSRQALDLLKKEGYPENAAIQVRVAEALLAADQSEAAVRLLENILAHSPDCADARKLLASYYEKQGSGDK